MNEQPYEEFSKKLGNILHLPEKVTTFLHLNYLNFPDEMKKSPSENIFSLVSSLTMLLNDQQPAETLILTLKCLIRILKYPTPATKHFFTMNGHIKLNKMLKYCMIGSGFQENNSKLIYHCLILMRNLISRTKSCNGSNKFVFSCRDEFSKVNSLKVILKITKKILNYTNELLFINENYINNDHDNNNHKTGGHNSNKTTTTTTTNNNNNNNNNENGNLNTNQKKFLKPILTIIGLTHLSNELVNEEIIKKCLFFLLKCCTFNDESIARISIVNLIRIIKRFSTHPILSKTISIHESIVIFLSILFKKHKNNLVLIENILRAIYEICSICPKKSNFLNKNENLIKIKEIKGSGSSNNNRNNNRNNNKLNEKKQYDLNKKMEMKMKKYKKKQKMSENLKKMNLILQNKKNLREKTIIKFGLESLVGALSLFKKNKRILIICLQIFQISFINAKLDIDALKLYNKMKFHNFLVAILKLNQEQNSCDEILILICDLVSIISHRCFNISLTSLVTIQNEFSSLSVIILKQLLDENNFCISKINLLNSLLRTLVHLNIKNTTNQKKIQESILIEFYLEKMCNSNKYDLELRQFILKLLSFLFSFRQIKKIKLKKKKLLNQIKEKILLDLNNILHLVPFQNQIVCYSLELLSTLFPYNENFNLIINTHFINNNNNINTNENNYHNDNNNVNNTFNSNNNNNNKAKLKKKNSGMNQNELIIYCSFLLLECSLENKSNYKYFVRSSLFYLAKQGYNLLKSIEYLKQKDNFYNILVDSINNFPNDLRIQRDSLRILSIITEDFTMKNFNKIDLKLVIILIKRSIKYSQHESIFRSTLRILLNILSIIEFNNIKNLNHIKKYKHKCLIVFYIWTITPYFFEIIKKYHFKAKGIENCWKKLKTYFPNLEKNWKNYVLINSKPKFVYEKISNTNFHQFHNENYSISNHTDCDNNNDDDGDNDKKKKNKKKKKLKNNNNNNNNNGNEIKKKTKKKVLGKRFIQYIKDNTLELGNKRKKIFHGGGVIIYQDEIQLEKWINNWRVAYVKCKLSHELPMKKTCELLHHSNFCKIIDNQSTFFSETYIWLALTNERLIYYLPNINSNSFTSLNKLKKKKSMLIYSIPINKIISIKRLKTMCVDSDSSSASQSDNNSSSSENSPTRTTKPLSPTISRKETSSSSSNRKINHLKKYRFQIITQFSTLIFETNTYDDCIHWIKIIRQLIILNSHSMISSPIIALALKGNFNNLKCIKNQLNQIINKNGNNFIHYFLKKKQNYNLYNSHNLISNGLNINTKNFNLQTPINIILKELFQNFNDSKTFNIFLNLINNSNLIKSDNHILKNYLNRCWYYHNNLLNLSLIQLYNTKLNNVDFKKKWLMVNETNDKKLLKFILLLLNKTNSNDKNTNNRIECSDDYKDDNIEYSNDNNDKNNKYNQNQLLKIFYKNNCLKYIWWLLFSPIFDYNLNDLLFVKRIFTNKNISNVLINILINSSDIKIKPFFIKGLKILIQLNFNFNLINKELLSQIISKLFKIEDITLLFSLNNINLTLINFGEKNFNIFQNSIKHSKIKFFKTIYQKQQNIKTKIYNCTGNVHKETDTNTRDGSDIIGSGGGKYDDEAKMKKKDEKFQEIFINEKDYPLLHLAAKYNKIKFLRYLIKKKENNNQIDNEGKVPIHLLITGEAGNIDFFRYLYSGIYEEAKTIPLDRQYWSTQIMESFKLLIPYSDLNTRDFQQRTLLSSAVQHGLIDIIKYLLTKNDPLDILKVDSFRCSPLFYSLKFGKNKITRLFIDHLNKIQFIEPKLLTVKTSSSFNLIHASLLYPEESICFSNFICLIDFLKNRINLNQLFNEITLNNKSVIQIAHSKNFTSVIDWLSKNKLHYNIDLNLKNYKNGNIQKN
ncbi:nnp-1 protein putative nuclear protein 1 nop52 [Anaeramoeba flamelloides]|uniref:Nnp-1 protein putative nuclear protein 1 nop52 n=1 Tax=Anaeramoeba flamelloides TaxID=1746091 RepID=A0AAV8ABK4_9EUKA|nr:nnp-1 protein putative nuclear protein 1 nop52 [Anaeramoeba flamelloides]